MPTQSAAARLVDSENVKKKIYIYKKTIRPHRVLLLD